MNIKVSEASGAVLDWLVAKCEGVLNLPPGTCRDCKHHEERAITDSSEHVCHLSYMTWTGGGYFDDTPFGDGISVDYGRHQNCPINELTAEPYSTKWEAGGPIIERERITFDYHDCNPCDQEDAAHARLSRARMKPDGTASWYAHKRGPTPLIAAMRCYVASKLGDTVEVPEELL